MIVIIVCKNRSLNSEQRFFLIIIIIMDKIIVYYDNQIVLNKIQIIKKSEVYINMFTMNT